MQQMLYRVYSYLILLVRTNRYVFSHLFGYLPPQPTYGNYWDWTTLIIKQYIPPYLLPGLSVLDMGTGPYGILAHQVNRFCHDCVITAADHSKDIIEAAKSNAPGANISYINSDLFTEITGRFDVIMFNAPYIGAGKWQKLQKGDNAQDKLRWMGGNKGNETIQEFLANCPAHMNDQAFVFLGVNTFYQSGKSIEGLIGNTALSIHHNYENKITKAGLYILKKAQK